MKKIMLIIIVILVLACFMRIETRVEGEKAAATFAGDISNGELSLAINENIKPPSPIKKLQQVLDSNLSSIEVNDTYYDENTKSLSTDNEKFEEIDQLRKKLTDLERVINSSKTK